MIKKLTLLSTALLATSAFANNTAQISFNDVVSNTDAVVVFKSAGKLNKEFSRLDKLSNGQLQNALDVIDYSAELAATAVVNAPVGIDAKQILVVGLGDNEKLTKDQLTKLGATIGSYSYSKTVSSVAIKTDGLENKNRHFASLLAHGTKLRSYSFDKYKKNTTPNRNFLFDVTNEKSEVNHYKSLQAIESGVFLARDLTNEVATEMTPVDFANKAKELEKLGVEVKILGPNELKELNMGALEAVGRGSSEGSRLVVAHYKGNNEAPIALVGKGITFDSGGYSIKTGSSIARMKSDMAGAAAVLGTVKALATAKAKVNVVAVMGMAANMVSETSVAPGDVVFTAEGKSVEIVNTDAEGRLVLADAMWYARKFFEPEIMVDLATLTGSKVRAVGNDFAAVFSDDDQLVAELTKAGKSVNENLWRLPLHYKSALKSSFADIQNIGSSGPGASTAASFLQHFAGDVKWAHIDIAGNALSSKAKDEVPTGGTGYGVRLLAEWLLTK